MKKPHTTEILACVVAFLVICLVAALLIRAWKRGSDRTGCILNIRNVQQAARGYSGMNNCQPTAEQMWKDIFDPVDFYMRKPICPSCGTYTFHKPSNICAPPGFLFCTCSHANTLNHKPDHTADW